MGEKRQISSAEFLITGAEVLPSSRWSTAATPSVWATHTVASQEDKYRRWGQGDNVTVKKLDVCDLGWAIKVNIDSNRSY